MRRFLGIAAGLAVWLLILSGTAFADTPEGGLPKGLTPSSSLGLERELFEEAEMYENRPVSVSTVLIGLLYGSSATDYAEFYDMSETGFMLGYYDDDRVFHEQNRMEGRSIAVYANDDGSITVTNWEATYRTGTGEGVALFAIGAENGSTTAFREERYHGGFLCVPWENGLMTVINAVPLEDYVKGVIPYEMSASWPYEALRAQAVCARTYVVYNQNSYEEYGFDLTADTESQVYRGVSQASEVTDAAADSTAGKYVRYRGELCEVYYFASDGGATEDGLNVFNSDRPYLAGKTDPFEEAVDYTLENWTIYRDGETISAMLSREGYEIGNVTALQPVYSELGNVIAMTYWDDEGKTLTLTGRDCYSLIRLNNCRFEVASAEEDDNPAFVFHGSGWGHNCGMSQWGAKAMAEVYGYSAEDIIRFYYTGAYIA